jgi:hypothetical protein
MDNSLGGGGVTVSAWSQIEYESIHMSENNVILPLQITNHKNIKTYSYLMFHQQIC